MLLCRECGADDGWTEDHVGEALGDKKKKTRKRGHLPVCYGIYSRTGCRLNARMNPITPAVQPAYIIHWAAVSAWLVPIIRGGRDRKSRRRYRGPDRPRGRHVSNHWGIRAADRVLAQSFLAPTRGRCMGYVSFVS